MKEDRYLKQFYRDVLPSLIRIFSPVNVKVFGSRVKGTATDDSDIEVIIVAESFRKNPVRKPDGHSNEISTIFIKTWIISVIRQMNMND